MSGLKLHKDYTKEYENIESKESIALIATIEPVILKLLQTQFGDSSVKRVTVTKLKPGSVSVDFAVVMATHMESPSAKFSTHINNEIDAKNTELMNIGVDTKSEIKAEGLFSLMSFRYALRMIQ